MEAKAREEAERRIAEEKKKKKRILEYLQQLWDEMLAEDAERSQIVGSKCKEVPQKMIETAGLPRRLKKNSQQDITETLGSRWEVLTPVRGVCAQDRTVLVLLDYLAFKETLQKISHTL